jgi:hypothetical protein
MAVQVKGTKVRHNGKVYHSGDSIEKIKSNDAKRLVDSGFAFFIEKNTQTNSKGEDILPLSMENE